MIPYQHPVQVIATHHFPKHFEYFNIHNMYISFFWGNTIILIMFWFQITCIPFLRQHYIPRPHRHIVFLFCIRNKFKNNDPCKNMGKIIKSYATTQVHFPREREGSLTAKGPNLSVKIWHGLTVHIIRF